MTEHDQLCEGPTHLKGPTLAAGTRAHQATDPPGSRARGLLSVLRIWRRPMPGNPNTEEPLKPEGHGPTGQRTEGNTRPEEPRGASQAGVGGNSTQKQQPERRRGETTPSS